MNSIEDLNQFTTDIEYEDPRPAAVVFNRGTAENGTQSVLEGQDLDAYVGIEIELVINYETANVSYTINVSNSTGATVSWASIPAHCTLTNPSTGVYTISGIRSNGDWDIIRSPVISTDYDYFGTFTYTSTINYLTSSSKSWTTTATVTDVLEWNNTNLPTYWFTTGSSAVTDVPLMVDVLNPTQSWYCSVIPSNAALVTSFTTAGTGGTTSLNATTKVLTINGTNAQINSHLSTLTFTTNGTVAEHFSVIYRLTNITSGSSDSVTQAYKAAIIRYLSLLTDMTYTEDAVQTLTGTPTITYDEAIGTESYNLQITADSLTALRTLAATGSGGSATWDNTNKRLTIVGTKAQVNSYMSNITFTPGQDYESNITLSYFLSINNVGKVTKTQLITNTATHAEVSNITLPRDFTNNVTAKLFTANIPQITDEDANPGNYTITLTAPVGSGQFAASGTTTSRTWTYTGTKTQVNAIYSLIDFIPDTDAYVNVTITYTQSKPGVSQVNTTFALNGPDVAFTTAQATNQTQSATEGGTFNSPHGIEILGVNDVSTTAPVYEINLSSRPTATVTWTTIPSGCVVTGPGVNGPGIYRISGITNSSIWNTVKAATRINLPNDYNGSLIYTSSIKWNNFANTMNWTVTATISDMAFVTAGTGFDYYSGQTYTLTTGPQIVDVGNQTLTYKVVVSPNVTSAITTMSSPNGTFSSGAKTLTITGTLAEVNSALNNISITPAATYESNIVLTFAASNDPTTATETGSTTITLVKLADVTFSGSATNQSQTTTEGGSFTQKVGADITFINPYDSPLPSYTINLTNLPNSTVTWYDPLPSGVTASNPSSNVFKLSGIDTVAKWNLVKTPTINLNNYTTSSGGIAYTASIGYNQSSTLSWSTAVIITPDVDLLTNVTAFSYYSGTTQTITGTPQLVDEGVQTPGYTVTVTPSSPSAVSSMSCTNGSFNSSTKVLTIIGSKAQINSALAAISLTSSTGVDLSYNMTYTANGAGGETSTKTQAMTSNNFTVMAAVRGSETYALNTTTTISNGPLFTDTSYDGYGNYVMTVVPTNTGAVSSLTGTTAKWWPRTQLSPSYFANNGSESWSYDDNTVCISDNGNTMAVLSRWEPAVGGNLNPVYIYNKVDNAWTLSQTIFMADYTVSGTHASRIALSGDGNTLSMSDFNNPQKVAIFVKSGSTFDLQTTIDPPSKATGNKFGYFLAINSNGNTLVVSENGMTPQKVYVYTRSGTTWSLETSITKNSYRLALSADGNTLAVGDAQAGGPTNPPGAIHVYTRSGTTWTLEQTIQDLDANGLSGTSNLLGWTVDISADGNRIASLSIGETAYVFSRSGTTWSVETEFALTGSNLGSRVDFANNGATLSINAGPTLSPGSAIFYKRVGTTWSEYSTITRGLVCAVMSEDESVMGVWDVYSTGSNSGYPQFFIYTPVSAVWNSSTSTLTLTGVRDYCNSQLDTIRLVPATGATANYELIYTGTTPSGAQGQRNQTVTRV